MADINMTPLIDVMLVLVVILLITAPLMVNAVKVVLPQSQGASAVNASGFLSLFLDPTGAIFVDDRPVSGHELTAALRYAAQQSIDTEVRLRADTLVPYGQVVGLMGEAHAAGLHRIAFVTAPSGPHR